MASMLDRLRAAQPISGRPQQASPPGEMLRRETCAHIKPDRDRVSRDTLLYLGVQARQDIPLEDFLFVDTETTGLRGGAGTVAFLIGAGRFEGETLKVKQYLIRDYPQEAQMLRQVFSLFRRAQCVVTYNGASFDMPLLESRATVNRLQEQFALSLHLDLIHAARRVFKLRIRQCSLGSIEERVFGEAREDDLPGADIPGRYFEYLKSRDEGLMDAVIRHNFTDIASLARLMLDICRLHEAPLEAGHQKDIFSIGKVYEKHGEVRRAAACFRACTDRDLRVMAGVRLADMYKRHRENPEAAAAYEQLLSARDASVHVYTALAKIYEHRLREPARALEIARQGMLYCAERRHISPQAAEGYAALEHRYLRLVRKVEQQKNGIIEQDQSQVRPDEASEGAGE